MSTDATLQARKNIRLAILLAVLQLGGALLLTLAHKSLGWIDGDTATRGMMVLIGFCIAAYGNILPKLQSGPPPDTLTAATVRQSILRVAGWALTLGGLGYGLAWIFAPADLALVLCLVSMGGATLVALGYSIWRYRMSRSTLS